MTHILAWFARPYFFNFSSTYRLKIALCVGVFVFLFLYIFRPFNLSILHVHDALEYTVILGGVSSVVVLFFLFIVPLLFQKYFAPQYWNIGKNLLFTMSCLLVIAMFCWLYSFLSKPSSIPTASIFHFILYTLSIGVFPLVLYYIIDEKISRQKRQKVAAQIKEEKSFVSKIPPKNSEHTFRSKNKKEQLVFQINELVYITSEGNYTCIYTKKNEQLKESIIRNTLTNISKDLEAHNTLIRCHKSYIINTKYIEDLQGNARGYILKSSIIPFDIPVSRRFPKALLKNLIGK